MSSVDLPQPLSDEIPRPRLVDLLAGRWNHALTIVRAPAGYGKSIALAQAIRDNADDPTGEDVYVRVRRRHGDAAVLAAAIVGEPVRGGDPADIVLDALANRAPATVCVHLDDVHELQGTISSVGMIGDLVRQLPSNVRLVLAGRTLPELPLGRLRAADQVLVVDAEHLTLTQDEQAQLADLHEADPTTLSRFEGWPAMTRLALAVGPDAPHDYLLEEVVDRLSARDRAALATAVTVGALDPELATRLGANADAPADSWLTAFAERIPLLWLLENGAVRPHDLWATVLDRLVGHDELIRLTLTAFEHHLERGEPNDAVELALTAGLWDRARRAVMASCAASDVHLTAETATDWIARFPPEQLDEPELLHLRGMFERLRSGIGHGDELVVRAMDEFHAAGRADDEAVSAFEVGLRAWLSNDTERLLDVLGRAPRLIDAGVTGMEAVRRLGDAGLLELAGDIPGAQRAVASIDVDPLPTELAEIALRHASTLSFLVGRGDEGLSHAIRLVERAPSPRNRFVLAKARFQCGDPTEVLTDWHERRTLSVGHVRDDFLLSVFAGMVDASLGLRPDVERVRELAWDRTREQTFVALVEAAALVIDGDEDGAAAHLTDFIDRIGIDDVLALGELRRFGPYSYVLAPSSREALLAAMGPTLRRRTAVAAALVDARAGAPLRDRPLPDPPEVLTILALPWSIELAGRLSASGDRRGFELGRYLLDHVGAAALAHMRSVVARDVHDPASEGVVSILGAVPPPPQIHTTVRVCGPLEIAHGHAPGVHPRRGRVRQLLALLVLHRQLRRDEVISVLWPELPGSKARNNLAQTLNYLRAELESERRSGEAPFHLRQDGERLALHANPMLAVDIWDIETELRAASTNVRQHHRRSAAAHLGRVADLWTGPPFEDLRDFHECLPAIHGLDRRIVDAVAMLAEWTLADGDPETAITRAEQVIAHEPWNQRAHAVVIAAALARDDTAAARDAANRVDDSLRAAGLRPGATLRMALRRLDQRLESRPA